MRDAGVSPGSRRVVRGASNVRFSAIRDDWYKANQLVPRLARNALTNPNSSFVFVGFPRQWIPIFEYYGLVWRDSSDPIEYMPLVSELSETKILGHCIDAREHGVLRTLVESISALDPVLADFVYILDNSLPIKFAPSDTALVASGKHPIRLTGWQSYGRPEVRRLELCVDKITALGGVGVVLPCSRQRPYGISRTHRRIWLQLREQGFEAGKTHQLVFTSLGIVPEELWEHVVVSRYDGGVPDIYRLLRLARRYFVRNQYAMVVDCLEFQPYSDVLSILKRERIIRKLIRGPVRASRQFFIRS